MPTRRTARPMARSAATPTPSTAAPSSGSRAPSRTSRPPASPSPPPCAFPPAARAAASRRAAPGGADGVDDGGPGGARPHRRAAGRRRAGGALSLPAPRVDGPAPAGSAPDGHPRAGGADARPRRGRARLVLARRAPRRLPRGDRRRARGVQRGFRVSKPRSLYVVDGHSHIFRAYHAVGYLSTSKGVPSHAVLILSTMLWKLIREEQPDYLGIALDPPGPTFRDTMFADYKATRTAMPHDLARQLPYVRRLGRP